MNNANRDISLYWVPVFIPPRGPDMISNDPQPNQNSRSIKTCNSYSDYKRIKIPDPWFNRQPYSLL